VLFEIILLIKSCCFSLNLILHFKSVKQNLTQRVNEMNHVKILELLIYSKQRQLGLSLPDFYSLVFQGLVRYKHNSFLCLSEQSLKSFVNTQGLSDELKQKGEEWLNVLREYQSDIQIKKDKKRQKREILKMKFFFKNLKKR